MNLLGRARASAAYRSGLLWQRVCNAAPVRSLPVKPQSDALMLLLAGRNYLGLLRESLLSLYRAGQRLPVVRVVSDGSLDGAALREFLRWWPNALQVRSAEELIAVHERRGRRTLAEFTRFHVMGKKLAAVVEACEEGPLLYCDVDVLWFRDPATLPDVAAGRTSVTMCPDYQMSYDRELAGRLGLGGLENAPYLNAGLMRIHGNLWTDTDLERWLAEALKHYNFFSEQTLFAALAKAGPSPAWSQSSVACFNSDATTLGPTYRRASWIARHYVTTVRHLFWRDALALRLGVRPQVLH